MVVIDKTNLELYTQKLKSYFIKGPDGATNGHIMLFDGATGKIAKDSGKQISDFATATDMETIKGRFDSNGKLPWSNLSGVPNIVNTIGGKSGTINLKENTAAGTISLVIDGNNQLSAIFNAWNVSDTASGYVSKVQQIDGEIEVTHTAFTTPVVTWTNGTSAGPTLKVETTSGTSTEKAIPSASASYSGVVTTAAQSFAGAKTFNALLTGRKQIVGLEGVAAGGIAEIGGGGGGGGTLYTIMAGGDSMSASIILHPEDETVEESSVPFTATGAITVSKANGTIQIGASQSDIESTMGNVWVKSSFLLDENNHILTTRLPDFLLGQVMYGGSVNGTGVCDLSAKFKAKYGITSLTLADVDAPTYEGVYFIASANGSSGVPGRLGVLTGDWIISTGSAWQKIDNTDAVTGVKGDNESSYRTGNINITKANIGLGNVENTAISTWHGSANITTLGTITTGTWHGSKIANDYLVNSGFKIGTNTISLGSERTAASFISDILGIAPMTEAEINALFAS